MEERDISLISDESIPEPIRVLIAEKLLAQDDQKATRALEEKRMQHERRSAYWNTPLVAAVAGLITLTATFVFDRLSGQDTTRNTITLEEVRQEFTASEARLRQRLEAEALQNTARLEALAREREFQYEIVKDELAKEGRTNSERAAVLLFLARAGVFTALDSEELQKMANEQQENPEQAIIPQLGGAGADPIFPASVVRLRDIQPTPAQSLAFSGTFQIISQTEAIPQLRCNAIKYGPTTFLSAGHCDPTTRWWDGEPEFETNRLGLAQGIQLPSRDAVYTITGGVLADAGPDAAGGFLELVVIDAARPERATGLSLTPAWTIRTPVPNEALFVAGYAPGNIQFEEGVKRALTLGMNVTPVISRDCVVLDVRPTDFSTDCITSEGMSGAPIVAVRDGALVGLVIGGNGRIGPTDGVRISAAALD